jgi:hypothetical protein
MRRRDFITLLGGPATWPLVARAQDRIRRIGVLSAFAENAFAFAIIGGLMVATTLTLVFLPALYVLWFRVKEPVAAESAVAEQVAV